MLGKEHVTEAQTQYRIPGPRSFLEGKLEVKSLLDNHLLQVSHRPEIRVDGHRRRTQFRSDRPGRQLLPALTANDPKGGLDGVFFVEFGLGGHGGSQRFI